MPIGFPGKFLIGVGVKQIIAYGSGVTNQKLVIVGWWRLKPGLMWFISMEVEN